MLLQKTEYDEAKEVNKLVVGECNFPPLSFIGGITGSPDFARPSKRLLPPSGSTEYCSIDLVTGK